MIRAALLVLLVALAPADVRAQDPIDPIDPVDTVGPTPAGEQVPPGEPVPAGDVPPPLCVEDASSARREIDEAFRELQRVHRNRVAGPSGQRLLERRIDELLERLVAFDLFVDMALGNAWDKAEGGQRSSWRTTLHDTLRRRYLRKLGSPLAAEVEIPGVVLKCDRAEVALLVTDRKRKKKQDVVLQLIARRDDDGVSWHAYDVAVDGVSLLETWKSRFRRIYADGGVAAIDHHMRGLAERYSRPE